MLKLLNTKEVQTHTQTTAITTLQWQNIQLTIQRSKKDEKKRSMKIQQEVGRVGGMEPAGHPVHNPQVKQAAVTITPNLPRQLYRECHPVLCDTAHCTKHLETLWHRCEPCLFPTAQLALSLLTLSLPLCHLRMMNKSAKFESLSLFFWGGGGGGEH